FTAVRGIRPWLTSLKAWQNLDLGEPPNQVYLWGLGAAPWQSYFAAASASASNQVLQLTERLLDKGNVWLQDHAFGRFVKLDTNNGARWVGLPFITPVLESVAVGDAHFIKGGFFP